VHHRPGKKSINKYRAERSPRARLHAGPTEDSRNQRRGGMAPRGGNSFVLCVCVASKMMAEIRMAGSILQHSGEQLPTIQSTIRQPHRGESAEPPPSSFPLPPGKRLRCKTKPIVSPRGPEECCGGTTQSKNQTDALTQKNSGCSLIRKEGKIKHKRKIPPFPHSLCPDRRNVPSAFRCGPDAGTTERASNMHRTPLSGRKVTIRRRREGGGGGGGRGRGRRSPDRLRGVNSSLT